MQTQVYILRCITHLHVGQGDSSMGVVDKQVQRDPTTKFPTIHSSGLKGALRQYFDDQLGEGHSITERLFGAGTQKPGKDQEFGAGKLFFGPGHLISLPIRSDKHPYFNVTTPENLQDLVEYLSLGNHPDAKAIAELLQPLTSMDSSSLDKPAVFQSSQHEAILEEESYQAECLDLEAKGIIQDQKEWRIKVEQILGKPFAIMRHADFQELSNDLPVIARNKLNNGISENLWYEEIVPREARFFCSVKGSLEDLAQFSPKVNNRLIQVGANATVGYGQALFVPLSI